MEAQVIFALSLAVFFFYGVQSATFTFANNCPYTVWPGTLTGEGPQLSSTGFQLDPKATTTLNVPAPWSGRFWGRTQCANVNGKFQCTTADCGSGQITCNGAGAIPPASLIEFTLAAPASNGQDFYDVSLVDGFNLPLSVTPQGGSARCNATSCPANVNAACPPALQVKGSGRGGVIACKSACLAFNQPQYCCTGAYNTPAKCQPTELSKIFKAQCPQAYSYAYDDKTSTFTCTSGANYLYEEASGQAINYGKSGLMCSNNEAPELNHAMSFILGIFNSLNTGRYLGLPLLVGRSKKAAFAYMKDRLWQKLQTWRSKPISKATREVLIKAAAQTIPPFHMGEFLMPTSTADELQKM
ncbi:hypothetical protein PTKIN_Ptkin13bG0259700 [Pterospermum kingtungense]